MSRKLVFLILVSSLLFVNTKVGLVRAETSEPVHIYSTQGLVNLTTPENTYWHELYPDYCESWNLTNWEDTGEPIGELSLFDQINMTNKDTGETYWGHVDRVTITLSLTSHPEPIQEMHVEFEGDYDLGVLLEPLGTEWQEIHPNYSRIYFLSALTDSGIMPELDSGDLVGLTDLDTSVETWWHVESVATGLTFNPPTISILLPENKTYPANDVPLTFMASEPVSWIGYSLDGAVNVTITDNTTLTNLLDGTHYVIVFANDTAGNMGSSNIVYFTIDTVFPSIEILSPENETYTSSSVSLSFAVDEATSWVGYSLDGQANVTITGNTTLSDLSNGSHSLIVYAKDASGNPGASETMYFTIEIEQGEPFPIWILVTIPVIIAIVLAFVVYLLKSKKTADKAKQ